MKSRSREIEKSNNANRGVLGILTGSEGGANAHWHTRLTGSKGHANAGVRRGSALLVVLGMLAFMLFSGLAFSVYMRQARLPTSFLRRTVATRQLAKAALAEAIEEIDTAIGNDPHPGVRASGKAFNESVLDNFWKYRVFTAYGTSTNPEKEEGSSSSSTTTYYPELVDPDETVPTLTLEGLAYLPPNLINEARYYSQRTPTAKWHSFWFDSGRYAYTAIDVSDYFDVNRVYANKPRSSGNRVSLAHLFEEMTVSGSGADREVEHKRAGSGADKWDEFMVDYRVEDGEMPLISLADLNVAWNENGPMDFGGASLKSPFCNFLQSGIPYSGGQNEAVRFGGMTFVTDSWFPKPLTGKTADGETIYDLASQQPFEVSGLKRDGSTIYDALMSYNGPLLTGDGPFTDQLNMLDRIALWDYLDQNKVPLSLAVPTCEQVPMICAIQPQVNGAKVTIITEQNPDSQGQDQHVRDEVDGSDTYGVYRRVEKFSIDLNGIADGTFFGGVAWTYPFLLKGQKAQTVVDKNVSQDSFEIDGRVAVYLSNADSGDMSARPGAISGLHLENDSAVADGAVLNASIVTFPIKPISLGNPGNVNWPSGSASDGAANGCLPVKGENFFCNMAQNTAARNKLELVTVTYEWRKTKKDPNGGPDITVKDPPDGGDIIAGANGIVVGTQNNFAILKSDGSVDTDYSFLRTGNPKNVKLNLAVWLRVTNAGGDTVDLVPACLADDKNLNSIDNGSMANKVGDTNPYPLMRLDVGQPFQFSLANFRTGNLGTLELKDMQLVTGDPRYNHAPEDWQIQNNATMEPDALAQFWYSTEYAYASNAKGPGDKDGDIYMATSDQGFMQSVYELAFLPRTQDGFAGRGGPLEKGDYAVASAGDGKLRTSGQTLMHHNLMWKTYRPFKRSASDADDFAEFRDGRIVSGDSGMKVNPYSDSADVLMAAFANTPHDWRMASTNNPAIWKNGEPVLKTTEFNENHAWNGYCDKAKGSLCWDCLQELADTFQEKVRSSGYSGNWESAFRDLGWSYKSNELLNGQQLDTGEDSDLFSVDKKFLYGFWHDSFAARQQLFLIFVRAEPMMMGGGVSGQTPPQLGARAVALVWRDPTKTQNRSGSSTLANPHRTRILFYHQFD